jgi:hypothetical protein
MALLSARILIPSSTARVSSNGFLPQPPITVFERPPASRQIPLHVPFVTLEKTLLLPIYRPRRVPINSVH